MKIFDFSYLCMVALHGSYESRSNPNKEFQPDLIRHLILDHMRRIHLATKTGTKPFVIACDDKYPSWRKGEFVYYKSHRESDRQKQIHIDWPSAFKLFDDMKQEFIKYTNWKVIQIPGVEADDIIAITVMMSKNPSDITVISPDKDFVQLLAYAPGVKIYDPKQKCYVHNDNPLLFLNHMIIEGDRSDGIPNMLSDDDSLVAPGKRQVIMTQKRRDNLLATKVADLDDQLKIRWDRNRKLIDFSMIPKEIRQKITKWEWVNEHNRSDLFSYFARNKLNTLLDNIQDFK